MKQVDLRISIKFNDDGSTGFVFEPLVPSEFSKMKLAVWQHGMITSLRKAVIAWSDHHDKVNNRTIKKYTRLQKKFMKEVAKAKAKAAAQKPVAPAPAG